MIRINNSKAVAVFTHATKEIMPYTYAFEREQALRKIDVLLMQFRNVIKNKEAGHKQVFDHCYTLSREQKGAANFFMFVGIPFFIFR